MRRITLALFCCAVLFSESFASSPFSAKGVGVESYQGTARAAALGGSDIAISDSTDFSLENPATWYNAGHTRFTVNGMFYSSSASDVTGEDIAQELVFPCMAIAIPLYRSLGLGLSYQPMYDHRYLIYDQVLFNADDLFEEDGRDYLLDRRVQGKGGLSKLSMKSGAYITSKLSVGVGLDYYFGKTEDLWKITSSEGDVGFGPGGYAVQKKYSGVGFEAGIMYHPFKTLTLGAMVRTPASLSVEYTEKVELGNLNDINVDNYELPLGFDVGLAYQKSRTRVSVHGAVDFWESVDSENDGNDSYINAIDAGIGYERLPSKGPLDPWYQRWTYRAGVRFGQYLQEINNNPVDTYGIAVGVGIPVRTHTGRLDVTFTVDFRGNQSDNLVEETIYGVRLGITSIEKWFVPRKRR